MTYRVRVGNREIEVDEQTGRQTTVARLPLVRCEWVKRKDAWYRVAVPAKRERVIRISLALLVIAQPIDVLTTAIALALGAQEINPIAAALYARIGPAAWVALKVPLLLSLPMLALGYQIQGRPVRLFLTAYISAAALGYVALITGNLIGAW